jgi:hypothetical protein
MDPFKRITAQLDKADDPTLLILRTHLLIEERPWSDGTMSRHARSSAA